MHFITNVTRATLLRETIDKTCWQTILSKYQMSLIHKKKMLFTPSIWWISFTIHILNSLKSYFTNKILQYFLWANKRPKGLKGQLSVNCNAMRMKQNHISIHIYKVQYYYLKIVQWGVGGWEDLQGTYMTCQSMHLIMTIKNIYGLWVGILTLFTII